VKLEVLEKRRTTELELTVQELVFRPRCEFLLRARSDTITLRSSRLTRRLRCDLILNSQVPATLHSYSFLDHYRAFHIVVLPLRPVPGVQVRSPRVIRAQESLWPDPDEEGAQCW
jgi:hypothetical protein